MNMMQLQCALAAAESGSISKAAEALYGSQPAVSLQIKRLEEELGFPLFLRTAQGVSLTPEGEIFCREARQVLRAWERLADTGARLRGRERLRIYLGPRVFSNGLFPKIVAFFESHPHMEAAFVVAGGGNFLEDLERGEIDLALNYLSSMGPLPDPRRFFCRELIREPQCVLTGPESALAAQESIALGELADCTLIAAPEDSIEARILERILEEHGVLPGRIYRLDGVDAAMGMVRSGTGVVLGPRSFAEYYGVRAVPLRPPVEESLSFVCLREARDRAGLRALRRYLQKICA